MKPRTLVIGAIVCCTLITMIFCEYLYTPAIKDQVKIGATYMTMNNSFYKALNSEVEKSVNSHNDVLYTRDPALDPDKQAQEIIDMMHLGIDVLIINPVDGNNKKINAAIQTAKKAGIKVIVVDTQLQEKTKVDCTIVSDNYDAGVQCAKNLMATRKTATILLLEHHSAMSGVMRIKGFLETIKGHQAYRVVARANCLGQTELAMPAVSKIIAKGITFDTVMALNDPAALGALAAIEANKLSKKIYVYGVDGSPNMKKLLADTHDVQATASQSPITMGKDAITMAYRLNKGQSVSSLVTIPVTLITQSNISQYDVSGWQ